MEAVRQVDAVTNTRDRLLQNRSSSKGKSSYYTVPKDSADLSPSAILLSREKMDINKSKVIEENQGLDYDLHFKDNLTKKLQAKGSYTKEDSKTEAHYEFLFNKETHVENIPQNKSLRFFLSFKFNDFKHVTSSPTNQSNIALHIRQLIKDIEQILGEKLDSDKIKLNHKDIKKFNNKEQQKISNKLIQLINATLSVAKMRKYLEEKQPEEISNLTQEKNSADVDRSKLLDFNLEIKEEEIKKTNST